MFVLNNCLKSEWRIHEMIAKWKNGKPQRNILFNGQYLCVSNNNDISILQHFGEYDCRNNIIILLFMKLFQNI
jgi:hypothetical protein